VKTYNLPILLVVLLLSSCASTQQYQTRVEAPIVSAPQEFMPTAGMARIYVVRKYAFAGSAVAIGISDSGRSIGRVGAKGVLQWDRPPGAVVIGASASNESNVSLTVSEGEVYILQTRTNWGAGFNSAACELRVLSLDEGVRLLREVMK
jgi:hypothetical protein